MPISSATSAFPYSTLFGFVNVAGLIGNASLSKAGCNADTNRRLAELQRMAKIKTRTTFHTARHTCATLLCHQGVPITTVQRILGHTKLTTTQLYSEVMADTIVRDLSNVRKNIRKRTVSLAVR